MDLTPFVGIIGAVIGGAIGLLGVRFNLVEQRRKDLRERVANLLREGDQVDMAARKYVGTIRLKDRDKLHDIASDMASAVSDLEHKAQYLHLTAPWALRIWVAKVVNTAADVSEAAMDMWEAGDPEGAKAAYENARAQYLETREGLVQHVRPKIYVKPWWVRKPKLPKPKGKQS